VAALRDGIRTFLLASQLTMVNMDQANVMFAKARQMEAPLPEPSKTYLNWVNARNVREMGPLLAPHIALEADPAASPERAPDVPAAPVFLLHGDEDTVIPAAESVVLANHLRERGADVRLLLSRIITHAELDRSAATAESWEMVSFWADILKR
jgi:acetyl esterase/lipase